MNIVNLFTVENTMALNQSELLTTTTFFRYDSYLSIWENPVRRGME